MRHRDDLYVFVDDPINDVEWKLQQNEAASTKARFRIPLWSFLNPHHGVVNFGAEFSGGREASFEIPVGS